MKPKKVIKKELGTYDPVSAGAYLNALKDGIANKYKLVREGNSFFKVKSVTKKKVAKVLALVVETMDKRGSLLKFSIYDENLIHPLTSLNIESFSGEV